MSPKTEGRGWQNVPIAVQSSPIRPRPPVALIATPPWSATNNLLRKIKAHKRYPKGIQKINRKIFKRKIQKINIYKRKNNAAAKTIFAAALNF